MSDINTTIIKGRLTADPERRETKDGTAVVSFSLANNIYAKGSEDYVNFFDCVIFGKRAEVIAEHFRKGSGIIVQGQIKQERWESEGKKFSKVRVQVRDFNFMDKKTDVGNAFGGTEAKVDDNPFSADDVPF